MKRLLFIIVLWNVWFCPAVQSATFKIAEEKSFFGVVIYKSGIGKGLAHNHFVVAPQFTVKEFSLAAGAKLEKGQFSITLPTKDLEIDHPQMIQKWSPFLKETGLLSNDVELSEISSGERQDIKEKAVGKDQLDAEKHPKIETQVKNIRPASGKIGNKSVTHTVDLEITIHGVTKVYALPAAIQLKGNQELEVTVVGKIRFTDFGIEPVSLFLGAIKNNDVFALVVHLECSSF